MRGATGIILTGAFVLSTLAGTGTAAASDSAYCDAVAQAESVAGQLKDRLDDGISDPSRAKSLLEKARTTAGKVADQAPPKVEDDWNTLVDGAHKLDPLVRDLADGKTDSVDLGKIWKSLGNSQMKIANSAAAIRADAKTRCQ